MSSATAIITPKGGSGKTTLALNIAACLHRRGERVLLIGADPQGTLTDWRGSAPEDADLPGVIGVEDPASLARELPALASSYEHAIIDVGGTLGAASGAALRAVDAALIPVRPSAGDLWAVQELVEIIRTRQELTGGEPKAAFVVSQAVTGANLSGQIAEALESYELPVFAARTGHRVAYAETLSRGQAVLDQPKSKAADEIRSITDELTDLLNTEDPHERERPEKRPSEQKPQPQREP